LRRNLGVLAQEFMEKYTATGDEGELILKRTKDGCVFLDGNDAPSTTSAPRRAKASAPAARHGLDPAQDVGVRRPRDLLPHRLQLDGTGEGSDDFKK